MGTTVVGGCRGEADIDGEGATAGDARDDAFAGFEAWYLVAWPRVRRTLAAYCGSWPLATEVAAEAFVRAAERWQDPARRPRNPDAWTVQVAFNLLKRRRWRERTERARLDQAPVAGTSSGELPDVDLWDAVRDLPVRMRQAVVLRYVGDFTEADVAQAMGASTGYVSSALSQARRRLGAAPGLATGRPAEEGSDA